MRDENSKVYVGDLPRSVTEPDLYENFEKFGPVESVALIKDHETGEPRGFAFVQFESESAADKALASMDKGGVKVKGQMCTVELSRPSRGRGGFRGGRGGFRGSRGRYSDGDRYGGGGGRDRYDDPPPRGDRYSGGGGDRYGGSSGGDRFGGPPPRSRYSPPPRDSGPPDRFDDRPPRFSGGSRGRGGYGAPRGPPPRDDFRDRESFDRRDSDFGGRSREGGYGGGGYNSRDGGDPYESRMRGGRGGRGRGVGRSPPPRRAYGSPPPPRRGGGYGSPPPRRGRPSYGSPPPRRGGYGGRDRGSSPVGDRYDSYRPRGGGPPRY